MAPMGTKLAYVSGHHRGCALHALFLFHHCAGQAPPEWLVRMGQQVPAHVESVQYDGCHTQGVSVRSCSESSCMEHQI